MTPLVVAIFALTYLLVALPRVPLLPIGRTAGALLGATLMVVVGAVSPAESFAAIDGDTIVLLLAMMLLTAELAETGFFVWASERVLSVCRTPRSLMIAVALSAGVGSALLVNDSICVFMTPIVVAICVRAGLPLGPYLIVLATSSNLGSAATLVGNPQNMLIGSLSHLPFLRFSAASLPVVVVTFALQLGLALWMYRKVLAQPSLWTPATVPRPRGLWPIGVVLVGVVIAFFLGAHLGYTAMAGALAIIVVRRREPRATFARVDWSVLLFFAGLFIVTRALAMTGLVDDLWSAAAPHMDLGTASGVGVFSGVMTLGCNTISNVPMVLLTASHLPALGHPELGFVLLAFVTTVAGNLTLVGSVANLIVAEGARDAYRLGFGEYARYGVPATLLVLAVGVPLLVWWTPIVM